MLFVLKALVTVSVIITSFSVANAIDLKGICSSTPNPDSCYASLAPVVYTQSDSIGHEEVYRLSVGVAVDEVSRAHNDLQNLMMNYDSKSLNALKLCHHVLSTRTVATLTDTLRLPNHKPIAESFGDHETWLTAAGIFHHNCLDAINQAGDMALRAEVSNRLKKSMESTRNSLSILRALHESSMVATNSKITEDMPSEWFPGSDAKFLLDMSVKDMKIDAVVAQDGSGHYGNIQDAVNAAPSNNNKRYVIYIKAGTYNEIVRVDSSKTNLMVVGDGMDATIITGNLNVLNGVETFYTPTFAVDAVGFIARDMRFENTAGADMGQAVALMTNGDKGIFYRCKFVGFQDTLCPNSFRQFFYNCQIYGTVDFIFGYSAAVFMDSDIHPRVPVPGKQNVLTAHAKTSEDDKSGFSFINCRISSDEDLTGVETYLGRPWKNESTVVFMNSEIGGIVHPHGWLAFENEPVSDSIYYGEHNNIGLGANTSNRVAWKGLHLSMSDSDVYKYGVASLIDGAEWVPKWPKVNSNLINS